VDDALKNGDANRDGVLEMKELKVRGLLVVVVVVKSGCCRKLPTRSRRKIWTVVVLSFEKDRDTESDEKSLVSAFPFSLLLVLNPSPLPFS
jgi:hypothetical protein